MKNVEFHPITRRLIELELRDKQMQDRLTGLEFVVGWLMAQTCPDESLRYLRDQATDLESSSSNEEFVALLDDLNEDVVQWLAQWRAEKTPPRS